MDAHIPFTNLSANRSRERSSYSAECEDASATSDRTTSATASLTRMGSLNTLLFTYVSSAFLKIHMYLVRRRKN